MTHCVVTQCVVTRCVVTRSVVTRSVLTQCVVARSRGPLVDVDGLTGTVLAAFASAVYIAPRDGPLVVLHHHVHHRTATSIIVDRGDFEASAGAIAAGDAAVGRAGHLRIGGLVVDVRQARMWIPGAPSAADTPPSCTALSARFDDPVLRCACNELVRALLYAPQNVPAALTALVGRGAGLTPAGDDAVIGVLAVLHRVAPDRVAAPLRALLAEALFPMLDRTTAISAHFLRLAADGHLGEALLEAVDDLARRGDVADDLIDRVLAVGATSGADALAGVASALSGLTECGSWRMPGRIP